LHKGRKSDTGRAAQQEQRRTRQERRRPRNKTSDALEQEQRRARTKTTTRWLKSSDANKEQQTAPNKQDAAKDSQEESQGLQSYKQNQLSTAVDSARELTGAQQNLVRHSYILATHGCPNRYAD